MLELTDADLLLRLRNFEDHFVERKTRRDSKDWLKTVVAFANSTPIGYPAVLYIGAKNTGEIEDGIIDLDSIQKTFNKKMADAYPPIYYLPKVLRDAGKQCLAVIIPGSENRPHFAGQSYVRAGSETLIASEPHFQALVAQRQSKVYEILKWQGKLVSVEVFPVRYNSGQNYESRIVDCSPFYVTLKSDADVDTTHSYSLSRMELSFDDGNKRLKLEVQPL